MIAEFSRLTLPMHHYSILALLITMFRVMQMKSIPLLEKNINSISGGSRIFQMGGTVLSQMGGRTSCFQVKSA